MPTPEPAVTFSTFVVSLASSALAGLGEGGRDVDLSLARQTLDLLAVLEAKTRGNLDEEEARLLAAVRRDLEARMKASRG
ncbi:MAG: hypothetical protein RLZZ299_1582 [Pseudomonadota bacterium]|jgi:hypothetical protein